MSAPNDGRPSVVRLLDCDVDHEPVGCGAVPVVLVRLEEHAVAGANDLYRSVLALAEPDTLGDEDRLPQRMGVPRGTGSWGEVNERRTDARWRFSGCDRVDVDIAGEPVAGAGRCGKGASYELH